VNGLIFSDSRSMSDDTAAQPSLPDSAPLTRYATQAMHEYL